MCFGADPGPDPNGFPPEGVRLPPVPYSRRGAIVFGGVVPVVPATACTVKFCANVCRILQKVGPIVMTTLYMIKIYISLELKPKGKECIRGYSNLELL